MEDMMNITRALQIEVLLRVTRGTMAEMVGPAALPIDRLSRRIGFRYSAEQQLPVIDEAIRRELEAFAAGVATGVRDGCRRPAHEFTLLRVEPTPYEATDILSLAKLITFLLASNWDSELLRLH